MSNNFAERVFMSQFLTNRRNIVQIVRNGGRELDGIQRIQVEVFFGGIGRHVGME